MNIIVGRAHAENVEPVDIFVSIRRSKVNARNVAKITIAHTVDKHHDARIVEVLGYVNTKIAERCAKNAKMLELVATGYVNITERKVDVQIVMDRVFVNTKYDVIYAATVKVLPDAKNIIPFSDTVEYVPGVELHTVLYMVGKKAVH